MFLLLYYFCVFVAFVAAFKYTKFFLISVSIISFVYRSYKFYLSPSLIKGSLLAYSGVARFITSPVVFITSFIMPFLIEFYLTVLIILDAISFTWVYRSIVFIYSWFSFRGIPIMAMFPIVSQTDVTQEQRNEKSGNNGFKAVEIKTSSVDDPNKIKVNQAYINSDSHNNETEVSASNNQEAYPVWRPVYESWKTKSYYHSPH
jgi:hypothetical protein